MKTKEITDLVTEYDNILHEFDRLKERQKKIIAELLDAKLPYGGKKLADIVKTHPNTISKIIKANYPDESRYFYKAFGIAIDMRNLKARKDREAEDAKWKRNESNDTTRDYYEFGKYPRFELM